MPKNGWMLAALWLFFYLLAPGAQRAHGFVRAGASYRIDKWDTEDFAGLDSSGLPPNEVIAITQTREGYLWLGTFNGLVRFDGIHFRVFDEENTPGLSSSPVVRLFEDSSGNLWIGSEGAGVALMKDGRVTSPLEIGAAGPERRLTGVCEDANGAVWLYQANGDLWRYSKGHSRVFVHEPNVPSLYRTVIAEGSGPVWVGTDRRQYAIGQIPADGSLLLPVDQSLDLAVGNRLDFLLASRNGGYWRLADGHIQKCRTNQIIRDFGPYPWGNTNVTAACEDREGNLLVGTKGAGVFWFDDKGNFQPLSTSDGLSHNYILSLLVDREGTLWVGTDGGGLNRIRQQVFEVLEGTGGLVVQSVSADEQGGLWFGCNSGEVLRWTNGPLQRFRTTQTPIEPSVRGILVDLNQQIWVGTVNWGLLQFRNGRFVRMPGPPGIQGVVQAMHEDRQGRLWFGTQAGLYCWDGRAWKSFNNGLSSGVVRALADDAQGNLWVGTLGGGLQVLRDDQFTSYLNADALPSKSITSLYVDGEGTVWVGTDGGGLARFGQGKWTRYRKREGLISNNLSYILEDGQGYLWIGSNAGLIRASKQALNDFARGLTGFIPFRTYGRPDGLPTAECTRGSQPAACRTRDGKLWFPTTKGLAWVDPAKFSPNTNPPPVVIDSVMIEGQEQISYSAGALPALVVPPSQERVEFHYASLNLGAPERARFKYRLEGHETAWTEAGNERVVRYTKLPPGHYHFQVTACNEDGVWNESGTSLPLTIEPPPPPFWRTWWFISLSSACLLGTIVAGVHRVSTKKLQRQLERLRQQEALEKERARIARDIHDQLGASLTQVALLGEFVEGDKDSPAEVEAHARQICQTARDTTRVLDEIVWTVNPSNDTLEGLVNYICKYAQDYLGVAGLRYRLDIPAQLPGRALPPELRHNVFLAAKEAITNIVRHSKASAAKVRLHLEPAAFILEIEDNGRGVGDLDQNKPLTRNGLRNMRKRMEEIGGRFSIDQAAEGGAIVRLTAPLGGNSSSKPHPSGSRRHESETEPI